MDPTEFIDFAGRVAAFGKAGARSAVSRAYYGLFHLASDLLTELAGEKTRGPKAHSLVPQYLGSANHPLSAEVSELLFDLHHDRVKADYFLSFELVESMTFAKVKVELALGATHSLRQFRDACLADPQLLQAFRDGVAKVKSIHQA